MVKIKKIVISATLASAALFFGAFPAAAVSPVDVPAAVSALLVELVSGEVLYEKNVNERHPADALARIMTLLLAASACEDDTLDINKPVKMTDSARAGMSSKSPTLGISSGEDMSLRDLMYCAYISGALEACNMIAEHISGSVDEFVAKMNSHARELGCTGTNFTNTYGRYDENQYTTALDQYIIFREAMSLPFFAEISGTYRYETDKTNKSGSRKLASSNSMLNTGSKYYYGHCVAGAASVTLEGGYSLVSQAETDGMSLVCVVLGSDLVTFEDKSTDMRNFSESHRLYEWGFSSFGWRTVLATSDLVAKTPVRYGDGADYINLRPESSIRMVLPNDVNIGDFERTVVIYSAENGETLTAPITAGDALGEVTLTRNGVNYGTVVLVANTNIDLHRMEFVRTQVTDALGSSVARIVTTVILLLIVGYIALVIRYNIVRRQRLRKIEERKKELIRDRQKQTHTNQETRPNARHTD